MSSCPDCKTVELVAAVEAAGYATTCPRCEGFFLSREGVKRLVEDESLRAQLLAALPDVPKSLDDKVVYLQCPECGRLMNRTQYARHARVIIDVCRAHGAWFQRGELRAILVFIGDGGLERARRTEEGELRVAESEARAERLKESIDRRLSSAGALARYGPVTRLRREVEAIEALLEIFDLLS